MNLPDNLNHFLNPDASLSDSRPPIVPSAPLDEAQTLGSFSKDAKNCQSLSIPRAPSDGDKPPGFLSMDFNNQPDCFNVTDLVPGNTLEDPQLLEKSHHPTNRSVSVPGHRLDDSTHINTLLSCQPNSSNASPTAAALRRHQQMVNAVWPTITPEAYELFPEFFATYDPIKKAGLPNFAGAKIPLTTGLNISAWKHKLSDYHDKQLCLFLQYGWPLGYLKDSPPDSVTQNHPSATSNMSHVRKFVQEEFSHSAIVGPFKSPPFTPWTRLSLVMTREKKDSPDRQIIVDLSFLQGSVVNDGINNQDHLGRDITYSLPSIAGKNAMMWKADLRRAYHQLRADPLDTPLMGVKVDDNVYLDLCPPFGRKSSAAICQRVANAVIFMLGAEDHFAVAYLDDYAGCDATPEKANASYQRFLTLADELGLQLAKHKC